MRKGIIDPTIYNNSNNELMLGNLAALGGSATWLMAATFFKLPISGTHSIVGATIGFSLVARGANGVHWGKLGQIVASWFISPVLSGLMSAGLYLIIRKFILRKATPLDNGLKALPIFYALTLSVNVFSIVLDGPRLLKFDEIPWWGAIILSCALGVVTGLIVQFFTVPKIRKSILEHTTHSGGGRPKFTFGEGGESGPGSAASSNSVTPDESRNVSMDNLPYNRVPNELEPAGSDLHPRNHKKVSAPESRKPRFGFRKSQVIKDPSSCLGQMEKRVNAISVLAG